MSSCSDQELIVSAQHGGLPPTGWPSCSPHAKWVALRSAAMRCNVAAFSAMQPQSDAFREQTQAMDLTRQQQSDFLLLCLLNCCTGTNPTDESSDIVQMCRCIFLDAATLIDELVSFLADCGVQLLSRRLAMRVLIDSCLEKNSDAKFTSTKLQDALSDRPLELGRPIHSALCKRDTDYLDSFLSRQTIRSELTIG
jgi:hypothetical protein